MASFFYDKKPKKHVIYSIIINYEANLKYLRDLKLDEVSDISIQAQISSLESFVTKLKAINKNLKEEQQDTQSNWFGSVQVQTDHAFPVYSFEDNFVTYINNINESTGS
jgi:hypothetical protein